jgi:hypothetical protein
MLEKEEIQSVSLSPDAIMTRSRIIPDSLIWILNNKFPPEAFAVGPTLAALSEEFMSGNINRLGIGVFPRFYRTLQ